MSYSIGRFYMDHQVDTGTTASGFDSALNTKKIGDEYQKNSMGSVGGELLRENTKYKKVSGCTDQIGFLSVMGWES